MELTDLELIQLWQNGDEKAFAFIHKRYSVQLLRVAMNKTGNREAAEEIVQDVFITLFKNKSKSGSIDCLIAYLYSILKNKVLDYNRHNLTHRKHETQVIKQFTDADDTMLSTLETKYLEREIADQVEKLPPKCKKVFKLSRQNYLPNKEIAALLHISENTVEQHMRKAIRILKIAIFNVKDVVIYILIFNTWLNRF